MCLFFWGCLTKVCGKVILLMLGMFQVGAQTPGTTLCLPPAPLLGGMLLALMPRWGIQKCLFPLASWVCWLRALGQCEDDPEVQSWC